MSRIVIQSHKDVGRPEVADRCMETVVDWANQIGCEYRFFNDELFDRVPNWIRDKCVDSLLPVTDYARLALAKELIAEGFDRVLWLDADIVVFDPERFTIPWDETVAFTREIWVDCDDRGRMFIQHNVANAASLFGQSQSTLDFLLERHDRYARGRRKIGRLDFGTTPLSALQAQIEWPMISSVGMASMPVLYDLARGGGTFARELASLSGSLGALNLCTAFLGRRFNEICFDDAQMVRIANELIESRGESLVRR